jgi:hypothetical protein
MEIERERERERERENKEGNIETVISNWNGLETLTAILETKPQILKGNNFQPTILSQPTTNHSEVCRIKTFSNMSDFS